MFVIPANKYSDEKMYSLNALNEIWLAKSPDIQFKTAVTSVTVSIMRVCAFGGYISAGYTGYWTSGCFYEQVTESFIQTILLNSLVYSGTKNTVVFMSESLN